MAVKSPRRPKGTPRRKIEPERFPALGIADARRTAETMLELHDARINKEIEELKEIKSNEFHSWANLVLSGQSKKLPKEALKNKRLGFLISLARDHRKLNFLIGRLAFFSANPGYAKRNPGEVLRAIENIERITTG